MLDATIVERRFACQKTTGTIWRDRPAKRHDGRTLIPLFKSADMESAARLLSTHFRMVYGRCAHWNRTKIRIRANLIVPHKIWFGKTSRQWAKWKTEGGIMMSSSSFDADVAHDAILFAECPRSIDLFDRACQQTRSVAVVYYPPTWRLHHESIAFRFSKKSERLRRAAEDRLERMIALLDAAPLVTSQALAQIRHGVLVPRLRELPSPSPVVHAAHASGTNRRVP